MSDLISRDALLDSLEEAYTELKEIYDGLQYEDERRICSAQLSTFAELTMRVRKAPTVDAVEVVRCFECVKRGNSIECPMCHDAAFEDDSGDIEWYTFDNTNDEGFCHYGERRKEDAVD